MKRTTIISFLFFLASSSAYAQYSNLKKRSVPGTGTVLIDSLPILKGSFKVIGVDTAYYHFDPAAQTLYWKKDVGQIVQIEYRSATTSITGLHRYDKADIMERSFDVSTKSKRTKKELIRTNGVSYSGGFGRSISMGNTQGAAFNSHLDLQLQGIIGDSIEVKASITDDNILVQPDGTTQQINEFDRVSIQFRKKNVALTVGDLDINRNDGYFLRFNKRVQGMAYAMSSARSSTYVSGSIAKGKFTRNSFNANEADQGPYRLTIPGGRQYFQILPATEKVFINGEQLVRGEENDYVINYNTAEIRFTAKRMITKDLRIQVEFEYSDRAYMNTSLYAGHEMQINKQFKMNIGAYVSKDMKNSSIDQPLSADQRKFLQVTGDDIDNALYTSTITDTVPVNMPGYRKVDTIVNGIQDTVYVHSADASVTRYQVNFSFVGKGKGDYIEVFNGTNGKLYQWVAPVNGISAGDHAPVQLLVTPKQQTVITFNGRYQVDSTSHIIADLATSQYDKNLFSSKDKKDDRAFAGRISYEKGLYFKKHISLDTRISYEHIQANFQPVERLRTVEFDRDHGVQNVLSPANEQLLTASVHLRKEKEQLFSYVFERYERKGQYFGAKHAISNAVSMNNWRINDHISYADHNNGNSKGYFFRPFIELSKDLDRKGKMISGISYQAEKNLSRTLNGKLDAFSNAFTSYRIFLRSEKKNDLQMEMFYREDQLPYMEKLRTTERSLNYSVQGTIHKENPNALNYHLHYRQLIADSTSKLRSMQSLTGKIGHQFSLLQHAIKGNLQYEFGKGQQAKRSLSYYEVPAGRGQYTWIDRNSDGIQQLSEFELARFTDQATFMRWQMPTQELLRTNDVLMNYVISFEPSFLQKNKKRYTFFSDLFFRSSLMMQQKNFAGNDLMTSPFGSNDSMLIMQNHSMENIISYGKGRSFGSLIGYNSNGQIQTLGYGKETRMLREYYVSVRKDVNDIRIEIWQRMKNESVTDAAFADRNYEISTLLTEPSFTYQYRTLIRWKTGYQLILKKELINGTKVNMHNIFSDVHYQFTTRDLLHARIGFHSIRQRDKLNALSAYVLLDGLSAGKNLLFNIDLTRRTNAGTEFSIQYEARTAEGSKAVHIGRASVRASLYK